MKYDKIIKWVLVCLFVVGAIISFFGIFSTLYLGESITWNHAIGFALIIAGAFFVFKG